MWGHKRKVRGTSTIFRPARHCAPHLQIASDATAVYNCFITLLCLLDKYLTRGRKQWLPCVQERLVV